RAFQWKRPWAGFNPYCGAATSMTATVFVLLSLGAIEGDPHGSWSKPIVPEAMSATGRRTYADLGGADLSTKPAGYTGLRERAEAELAQIRGASLAGADLRRSDASNAFLTKADLDHANLQGATLSHANLHGADLEDANLQGAVLFFFAKL